MPWTSLPEITLRAAAVVPPTCTLEACRTIPSLALPRSAVPAALRPMIASSWSLATALSLLAWYVFAPQCLSTLATVRRETNSWRYPLIMAGYLFAMAWVASFATYRIALAFTGGA